MKWPDEGQRGGGVKSGRETWAKVKTANLFPVSPAVPERQTTHCLYKRGFGVDKRALGLNSSAPECLDQVERNE